MDYIEKPKGKDVFLMLQFFRQRYKERKSFRRKFAKMMGNSDFNCPKPNYLMLFFYWFYNREKVLKAMEMEMEKPL